MYLYENNNNLIYTFYNNNSDSLNNYLFHSSIINKENILNFKNTLFIKKNHVTLYNNDLNNTFNINIDNNKYLSINNKNTIINSQVLLDNINLNDKLKQILYDYYGPKDPYMNYDFRLSNNIILYSYDYDNEQYINYFEQNITNNITLHKIKSITYNIINNIPYYNNCGYNINIDVVYFTEIILINNNIRTFYNNIKSYTLNNLYNYDVTIYYYSNNIIYPKIYINKNGVDYIYGLKTEIK